MSRSDPNRARADLLPKFVGYAEVGAALGVSRRTVERMVRAGIFPKPVQLAPNRVGWQVEAVEQWLSDSGRRLEARAVSRPEDLEPDQLISEARKLIAQATVKQLGVAVDPDAIASINVSRSMTMGEFQAAEVSEFAIYSERFKDIDPQRAFILAAWLFPPIRPFFESAEGASLPMLSDPNVIARLGPRALHDESWAELDAELQVSGRPAADNSSV